MGNLFSVDPSGNSINSLANNDNNSNDNNKNDKSNVTTNNVANNVANNVTSSGGSGEDYNFDISCIISPIDSGGNMVRRFR